MRLWLPAVACCFVVKAAAGGYGDFGAGIGAYNRGDCTSAVELFTKALTSGDLATGLQPTAYIDRGLCHLRQYQAQDAAADLESAEKLDPSRPEAHIARASALRSLDQPEAAIREYSTYIELSPKSADGYYGRAITKWIVGNFSDANSDLERAWALGGHHDGYDVLWTDIIAWSAQSKKKDSPQYSFDVGLVRWPGPLVKVFLGESTVGEARLAATLGDPQAHTCELDFFLGEWSGHHGEFAEAKSELTAATKECPPTFVARPAAAAALKRLETKL